MRSDCPKSAVKAFRGTVFWRERAFEGQFSIREGNDFPKSAMEALRGRAFCQERAFEGQFSIGPGDSTVWHGIKKEMTEFV